MSCISVNKYIGCKFKIHGRSKEEGFDCYGLVIQILKDNGIILTDAFYVSLENNEDVFNEIMEKSKIIKIDNPEKLCIIVIKVHNEPTHVALYIGEGQIVHSVIKKGVIIEPLHRYRNRIEGYYKVSNS